MNSKDNSNLRYKKNFGGRNIEDALWGYKYREFSQVCVFYLKISQVHVFFLDFSQVCMICDDDHPKLVPEYTRSGVLQAATCLITLRKNKK